jgi:4-hydroxybenzoyl-CoA reductase subunit alpha
MKEYSVIGKRLPRKDGVVKAVGEAKYAADMTLPKMLFGKILRSPYPHAKIIRIDTGKAEKLPGVKAVVTGKDTPGVQLGIWGAIRERQYLPMDKVRFIGEAVAGVAAIDEDTAQDALELIQVEYEELPAVFDAEEATKEGAPQIHDHAEHNISLHRFWNYGDVEKGFEEADYIREDQFSTPLDMHGFIEPNACLAAWDASGKLTMWASTQIPFAVRAELALVLGIPQGKVRVIKTHVGGGFGGKAAGKDLHTIAALLAKKSGRPVRIEYDMGEQFVAGIRRIPAMVHLKTGVRKDGTLLAQSSKVMTDGGAYQDVGRITIYLHGLAHLLPYRLPNFRLDIYRIYTNNPVCGPKRGHGHNQIRFAFESQLDMIAEELGIDPVEIRLRNALQPGDITVNGLQIGTCGLSEAIQKATERAGWKEKRGKGEGRGIGIGCGGFISGYRPGPLSDAGAVIKLNEDGGVVLLTGASDIGQGSDTVLAQIVAEVLGVTLDDVTVVAADTETCPYEAGSIGSRVTWYAGNAAKLAAEDVRRQLAEVVATKLEMRAEGVQFKDGWVYAKGHPEFKASFAQVVGMAQVSTAKGVILGKATYYPDNVVWPDRNHFYFGNFAGSYSFSAQVAEVEVDKETGQVRLVKATLGDDCGFPLNPMAADGQVEGSVYMGHGETLFEQVLMENGKILNPSFTDYKMPTALDSPNMETIHIITDDPGGPFGAKEVGEGFIISGHAAIANAIHDATGVWITDLPITPQKIVKALEEKERKEEKV